MASSYDDPLGLGLGVTAEDFANSVVDRMKYQQTPGGNAAKEEVATPSTSQCQEDVIYVGSPPDRLSPTLGFYSDDEDEEVGVDGDDSVSVIAGRSTVRKKRSTKVLVEVRCPHQNTLMSYLRPCLVCDIFCNCKFTMHYSNPYPDVLVRSLDRSIVRLSKHLVRASVTLSGIVNKVILKRQEDPGSVIKEHVVLATEPNYPYFIKNFWEVAEDEDLSEFLKDLTMDETINVGKYCGGEEGDKGGVNDVFDYNKREELLVLFNPNDSNPTFGIKKEVLVKIDQYVCNHLEEVEARAAELRREYDRKGMLALLRRRADEKGMFHMGFEESGDMINAFKYEDWEEEFFDLDTLGFLDLQQANQELLIWDLYYAIEKWVHLWRGFPKVMENGVYDFLSDPDYDPKDSYNIWGISGVAYTNPKRRCLHKTKPRKATDFNVEETVPRWWILKPLKNMEVKDDMEIEILEEKINRWY